jgi:hypothetical protein
MHVSCSVSTLTMLTASYSLLVLNFGCAHYDDCIAPMLDSCSVHTFTLTGGLCSGAAEPHHRSRSSPVSTLEDTTAHLPAIVDDLCSRSV